MHTYVESYMLLSMIYGLLCMVALNTQKWHQILCNSITKSFTGETGLVIHPLKHCEKATIGSVKDFKNLQISLYFVPAHSIYVNT